MREVIGRRNIQAILTTEQASVASEVQEIMQGTLDAYGAGVQIQVVQLRRSQPPAQVREAFFDVNAAQQDAVRVQNEAETFASQVVPRARGEAAQTHPAGRGLPRAVRRRGDRPGGALQPGLRGSTARRPTIIRERIFLETMERVLGGMDKIIIDQNGQGQGVVPLPAAERAAAAASRPAGSPPQGAAR